MDKDLFMAVHKIVIQWCTDKWCDYEPWCNCNPWCGKSWRICQTALLLNATIAEHKRQTELFMECYKIVIRWCKEKWIDYDFWCKML